MDSVPAICSGIEGLTSLSTDYTCGSVSNAKPDSGHCFDFVVQKANDFVADCVTEKLWVTSDELGIDSEPSPSLFSRYYFDIVSADDEKSGVYIIDQPRIKSRRLQSRLTSLVHSRGWRSDDK